MRWISSRESIEREEISLLAIVETVFAITASGAICVYLASFKPIALASVLAPFLLLRTATSVAHGLRLSQLVAETVLYWTKRLYNETPEESELAPWQTVLLYFCILTIGIIYIIIITSATIIIVTGIRVLVTISNVFRHPLDSIGAIPQNWRKVTLCTDTGTLPELIPGIEQSDIPHILPLLGPPIKLSDLLDIIKHLSETVPKKFERGKKIYIFTGRVCVSLVFAMILLVSMLYRFSLKSTALIWSPLLWIVGPILQAMNLCLLVNQVIKLEFFRMSRYYSILVLVFVTAKIFVLLEFAHIRSTLDVLPGWSVFRYYVVPDAIPLWHIAAALNAVLAWAIFFKAERLVGTPQLNDPGRAEILKSQFTTLLVIRNFLTVYTVLCTLYITVQIATSFGLPRVVLFPWTE